MMNHRGSRASAAVSLCAVVLVSGAAPERGGQPASQVPTHAAALVPPRHSLAISVSSRSSFSDYFAEPRAWSWSYWQTRALPPRLIDLPLNPIATDADRAQVQAMKQGDFQPVFTYPPLPLGVPPPWDTNPYGSSTWDLYRHSLIWTEPLVRVWLTDGDEESRDLMCTIIADWQAHNAEWPGASAYAWNESAVAWRCQRLLWFWEMYRTHVGPDVDMDFAMLLLDTLHAQAAYCADDTHYHPQSNHGLMLTTALLEVVGTLPQFIDAPAWQAVVYERMPTFVEDNFSALGFHMEQTPAYHDYLVDRLARMAAFANALGMEPVPRMDETARSAAALTPWLAQPNGTLVSIGDCSLTSIGNYAAQWDVWWPHDPPVVAPSTLANPRQDESCFLVDPGAGYAILAACPPYGSGGSGAAPDTYASFRCNATPYGSHVHVDALSFTLYGGGRAWVIDPGGPYNYQFGNPRAYLVGYRAHNVLLVDEAEIDHAPVEVLSYDRLPDGDFVECRHKMPTATQVRRFTLRPPHEIEVRDAVVAADGVPHHYSQLFHMPDDVVLQILSDTYLEAVAPDGTRCAIKQVASTPGAWRVISAQTYPYWQGWRTTSYGTISPAPTVYYSTATLQRDWDVTTTLRLLPATGTGAWRDFIDRMSGVGQPCASGCGDDDIDLDQDADLGDLAAFQRICPGL